MPRWLEDRVAIVTGGGWNIGRAIACRFAAEGAKVVVAGRRKDRLDETVRRIASAGGTALAIVTDVTSDAAVQALARAATTAFGTIDVMAAIAGGGWPYQSIEEIAPETWDQVIRQNLTGTFLCARAVLPTFRKKDAGVILTCAGGGAFFPVLGVPFTGYACAKAAVCRFTDQLTAELWDTKIRVNCLEPGMVWDEDKAARIATEEQASGAMHPLRPQNHTPQEAAELALWLVSAQSGTLRGRSVSVNDTWWRDPAKVAAVDASLTACRVWRHPPP